MKLTFELFDLNNIYLNIQNQSMSNWKKTADLFEPLIDKPKMNQKYLSKPPFKYIFDIISETTKKTGFAQGLYEGDQQKGQYYGEKTRKITYLTKIISLVEAMEGTKVGANPQKIVAGMQAELTNQLLQLIHKCATGGKPSDPYVKKVLGGGGAEQPQQTKQPEKKKIERPPSAAKNKKTEPQQSKKSIEKPHVEEPKQEQREEKEQQPQQKAMNQPKKGQQYSNKVKELMQEGDEEVKKERQQEDKEDKDKKNIQMGRLNKKKKKTAVDDNKIISGTGELSEKELDLVKGMIQSICQNTAPLGKSIQFINDDIQSMNKQLQYWRKQYHASKTKMQNQLKVTEEALLPIYDKLADMQEQIKDQRGKIQTAKAQIIKNDSTIKDLLMSVVATK